MTPQHQIRADYDDRSIARAGTDPRGANHPTGLEEALAEAALTTPDPAVLAAQAGADPERFLPARR